MLPVWPNIWTKWAKLGQIFSFWPLYFSIHTKVFESYLQILIKFCYFYGLGLDLAQYLALRSLVFDLQTSIFMQRFLWKLLTGLNQTFHFLVFRSWFGLIFGLNWPNWSESSIFELHTSSLHKRKLFWNAPIQPKILSKQAQSDQRLSFWATDTIFTQNKDFWKLLIGL